MQHVVILTLSCYFSSLPYLSVLFPKMHCMEMVYTNKTGISSHLSSKEKGPLPIK